jgi:hypothetical protein
MVCVTTKHQVVTRAPTGVSRILKAVFALLLLTYFVYFSWDVLQVHFAADDMMNLAFAWRPGPAQLVLMQFMPWREFYRPMAGLFYASLLHFFGLNPAPYHVAILCILLINVYLLHRLAKLLGGDNWTAGLVSVLACYHAGLSSVYYNIAYAYDALCGLFYFSALVYYLRTREAGESPKALQVAAFLALCLCALNSKEMAVTLPVILLVYECLYNFRPLRRNSRDLGRWLVGPGRVLMYAAALDIVYIFGRMWAPGAMTNNESYRPVVSRDRILDFQIRSFSDLFESWNYFGWREVLVLWLLLGYLAWRRDRPILKFCWYFLLLTPLPIEFLKDRVGGRLYIPFAGWAIFLSVVFVDLARRGADFLAGEPLFRHLGRRRLLAALIAAGVFLWARENHRIKRLSIKPTMAQTGLLTWNVIQQVRALNVRARPNSTVVVLNDPFAEYDMQFIFELWMQDRSVIVWLERLQPHTPAELAHADYAFDYRDDQLLRVK